jgi:hypothetical protein
MVFSIGIKISVVVLGYERVVATAREFESCYFCYFQDAVTWAFFGVDLRFILFGGISVRVVHSCTITARQRLFIGTHLRILECDFYGKEIITRASRPMTHR